MCEQGKRARPDSGTADR